MTDVVIIGAGIAGMTSTLIVSDVGMSVRLIDKAAFSTPSYEEHIFKALPIFKGFTPTSLIEALTNDISKRGIEITRGKVLTVSKSEDSFMTVSDCGVFFSHSVIIAAGKDHGIKYSLNSPSFQIDEECRATPAGLLLCGNARREAGLLRSMADGIVCGETAIEWVRQLTVN